MPRMTAHRAAVPSTHAPRPTAGATSTTPAGAGKAARQATGVLAELRQFDNKPPRNAHAAMAKPAAPPSVEGYFYLPFVGEGTANSVIGEAMRRVAKGGAPYPVIAANLADAQALRAGLAALARENASMLAAASGRPAKLQSGIKGKQLAALIDECQLRQKALASLSILDAQALATLPPTRSKLYLNGHGAPGKAGVVHKRDDGAHVFVSASALSSQLKAAGLPADFEDIRAKVCWSADRRRLTSFAPDEGRAASTPEMAAGPKHRAPLGAHLVSALHADGFTHAAVTGYHGMSLQLPRPFGQQIHAAQVLDKGAPRRRSTVKERFTTPLPAAMPKTEDS